MDVNELLKLIQQPAALLEQDSAAIEQLTIQYPYFQTAWLLLARKSLLQNEPLAEEKLNLAAAHVINRVKLYMFLHQPPTVAGSNDAVVEPVKEAAAEKSDTADSLELDGLLRSIHERKQQILSTAEEEVTVDKSENKVLPDNMQDEAVIIEEGITPPATSNAEQETLQPAHDPGLDASQLKLEENGLEFMLTNETAGNGEYIPLNELLNEENDEYNFTEERDPEVESNTVIEEEFILNDIDQDLKLLEIGNISTAESKLLVETENEEAEMVEGDKGLIAWKELELEVLRQDEAEREAELELINKSAGGGAEFTPMEIAEDTDEPETIEVIPELDSIMQLESIAGDAEMEKVNAAEEATEPGESSLRFSEHVPVPGQFLPGKSHSFIDWLRFFKPENKDSPVAAAEKPVAPSSIPAAEETPAIGDIGTIGAGMLEELNAIDRIVSSIRHEAGTKPDLLRSPAELARKSVEMDDELVTETLASIYEEQGLIDKAIRTYARLSLKFPEKSLFFAARIKALKSKK
ncbi:MAG: hypothetical protein K1X61_04655 [Chitinophagales bacterium]|nr:hypothetical protein [Chitinophagales bacterium]